MKVRIEIEVDNMDEFMEKIAFLFDGCDVELKADDGRKPVDNLFGVSIDKLDLSEECFRDLKYCYKVFSLADIVQLDDHKSHFILMKKKNRKELLEKMSIWRANNRNTEFETWFKNTITMGGLRI